MLKRYAVLFAALLASASCNDEVTGLEPPSDPSKETFAPSLGVDLTQFTLTTGGVYYRDVTVGTGTDVVTDRTDSVFVTYAGYLKDGTLFDSNTNTRFIPAEVLSGFRIGLLGMKAGGKRKIVIPSEQGYGGRTIQAKNAKIPRQSTLVFDVDLLRLHNPATTP